MRLFFLNFQRFVTKVSNCFLQFMLAILCQRSKLKIKGRLIMKYYLWVEPKKAFVYKIQRGISKSNLLWSHQQVMIVYKETKNIINFVFSRVFKGHCFACFVLSIFTFKKGHLLFFCKLGTISTSYFHDFLWHCFVYKSNKNLVFFIYFQKSHTFPLPSRRSSST